jgi:hypothetical protein
VVHGHVGIFMPGEEEPPQTRLSRQLFVTAWRNDRWVIPQDARRLSLETMGALESLAGMTRRGSAGKAKAFPK